MKHNIFWGVALILFGGILFINSMGWLGNIHIWSLIGPLFLIFTGLWIMLSLAFRREGQAKELEIPTGDAQRATLLIRHGAGRLKIAAGDTGGNLVKGSCFGGVVVERNQLNASDAQISLSMPVQLFPLFWSPGWLDWNLTLNPSQQYQNLELNTGAGESDLDLEQLRIDQLIIKTGASSTNLKVPGQGTCSVSIEAGAAAVNIVVPENVAAQISSQSGMSGTSINQSRFPRQGKFYSSPGYATASNRVDIVIHTGFGSISVQ